MKKNISELISGQDLFIGIDVHAKSYVVAVVNKDGDLIDKATTEAKPEVLIRYLNRFQEASSLNSVYEAGFSGFYLHRELEKVGINNIIVNPGSIEIAINDRVKTDKKDAKKLAIHLSQRRLKGIRIPSEAQEKERVIHRVRASVVGKRARLMVEVRLKLRQFNLLPYNYCGKLKIEDVEEILSECDNFELQISLQELLDIWRSYNKSIKRLDGEIKEQAKESKTDEIYRSIPGVGVLTARILSSELGDMKDFSNGEKLASFVGLTPCEHSSGGTIRKGNISKRGPSRLRVILVEAAWAAIRSDENLRSIYNKMSFRMGGKRAIVALARKLLLIARALAQKGELYNTDLLKA